MTKIVLTGNQGELKAAISTLLGVAQLINEKDIGEYVGYPLDEYVRTSPQSLKLYVNLSSNQQPPFQRKYDGKTYKWHTYGIPNVSRTKIDWKAIKDALGGTNGYLSGRFYYTAKLSSGRQMRCFGSTADEAKDRTLALLKFSEDTLLKGIPSEQEKKSTTAKGKVTDTDTVRVYPAYMYIMNQQRVNNLTEQGIPTNTGDITRKKTIRIPLWIPSKPSNFDEIINECLKDRGKKI